MSQPVPVPGRSSLVGGATGRTLEEHYELGEVLGRGSFSVVHKAVHRQTGEQFACKLIDKWSIHNRQRLANEIEVLQRVTHPAVIRLHDIFETDRVLALVTDVAAGGELFDKVVDKGHYSEKEASEVVEKLLQAIGHLHKAGIVHRDIKPENILLASTTDDVDVKLSDFGLAKIFSGDDVGSAPDNAYGRARAFTVCGTDYYVAPEVLQQAGYTQACDLWSIGVVLYILLSGCPPFYEGGEEGISVQRKIVSGSYSFPDRYWSKVSAEAKDLVTNLLQVDPERRYSVQQALEHAWVKGRGVSQHQLPRENVELLRSFNNKRKNSIAGSPLVGSYSVFGSLQSPAESSFHMPGKHRRMVGSVPHSVLNGGPACGSVPEGYEEAGVPRAKCGAAAASQAAPSGSYAAAVAGRFGGGGGGGSLPPAQPPAGSLGGSFGGPHASGCGSLGGSFGGPHTTGGGLDIPGAYAGGRTASRGVPIPGAANRNGGQHPGQETAGSLSTSPPGHMLSASPNPGAAFLMEI